MRRLLASLVLSGVVGIGLTVPAVANAASPSTYYVNCQAKAGGDGFSASHPWNSLDAVNSHAPFVPGERILFARGSSCTGRLHPVGSGSSGHPVTIGAYGKGAKPKVAGAGTADRTATIDLKDQSYWTVQDLAISNWTGSRNTLTYRAGVRITNDSSTDMKGIVIQRLTISKVSSTMSYKAADPREWGAIIAVSYGAGTFSGLKVLNNRIDHVGRTGIMIANHAKRFATGVRLSGNYVTWTRGDGIVVRGASAARVDHNRVGHASDQWPCPECGGISTQTANAAIWAATSKNTLIDHNEAWGTKFLGGDGEGFDIDASATGTVLEYNYAHDNQGGGVLFCGSINSIARFNIIENNSKSALAFIGSMPAKNTSIYNNTIYVSKTSGAGVVRYFNGAHGSGIKFYNNIVYSYAKGYYMWPTRVWSRDNTYVGTHNRGEPRGAGYSWAAPGLKKPGSGGTGMTTLKGYKPAHPSTFKKGVAIPKTVTRDFFGKKIDPKHPPRGAAG